MSILRQSISWFFVPPLDQVGFWRIVGWWELRRVVFTAFVFGLTLCALLIYLYALAVNEQYEPDALLALLPITLVANVCYTSGWVIDSILTKSFGKRRRKLSTTLLVAGLLLWLVPCLMWASLGVYGIIGSRGVR